MFCTRCGRELKVINENRRKVGYCSECNIKVILPMETKETFARKGFNILDGIIDKTVENGIKQRKKAEEERKHREVCEKDIAVYLIITFGYQQLGINQQVLLRQKNTGVVYFDYNDKDLFRLVSYQWEGAEYATVSNNQQSGTTKYRERSKQRGRGLAVGLGATVGTIVAPGAGTIVGAAIGASGPRRTKTKGKSFDNTTSTTRTEDIEKDTQAQLVIQNIETGVVSRLRIVCNRTVDGRIQCLDWGCENANFIEKMGEMEEATPVINDYSAQLFQLKDLLVSGIITEEEFNLKKKQLLGL